MLQRALRALLARSGYVLWKTAFMRFGVSPHLDIQRLAQRLGTPIRVFFDVGANAGQTTTLVLKDFPAASVHAFEPHPRTYARLQANVRDPRVKTHPLALADRGGELTFHEYGTEADGSLINSLRPDSRFVTREGYAARQITIRADTLDAFCEGEGLGQVDVLKIDTEGCEMQVLQGAVRMLGQGRIRFIYLEYNELSGAGGQSGALAPIAEMLWPFGYRHVATYTDFVLTDGPLFVCANALFVLDPAAGAERDRAPASEAA